MPMSGPRYGCCLRRFLETASPLTRFRFLLGVNDQRLASWHPTLNTVTRILMVHHPIFPRLFMLGVRRSCSDLFI